jgi:catechol 2,3-dioxygenase-like lactoylglutathione lyase family enzyme
MKLHHVALGAQDVDALAAFYRDVLGLPELARHRDGVVLRSVWLDLGGAILMIERTHEPARRVEGVGAGPFLLALRCTVAERAALEARLAAAGSAIESRTAFSSYARDPEGNRIALSHHPDR